MTAIKINNTIEHNGMQCVEGRLVLIKISDKSGDTWVGDSEVQPIIISKTEEIESGDYISDGNTIYKNTLKLDAYIGIYKIIALPKHFTKQQLQDIVDGKLNDGDIVMVKCDTEIDYECFEKPDKQVAYFKIKQPLTLHKK